MTPETQQKIIKFKELLKPISDFITKNENSTKAAFVKSIPILRDLRDNLSKATANYFTKLETAGTEELKIELQQQYIADYNAAMESANQVVNLMVNSRDPANADKSKKVFERIRDVIRNELQENLRGQLSELPVKAPQQPSSNSAPAPTVINNEEATQQAPSPEKLINGLISYLVNLSKFVFTAENFPEHFNDFAKRWGEFTDKLKLEANQYVENLNLNDAFGTFEKGFEAAKNEIQDIINALVEQEKKGSVLSVLNTMNGFMERVKTTQAVAAADNVQQAPIPPIADIELPKQQAAQEKTDIEIEIDKLETLVNAESTSEDVINVIKPLVQTLRNKTQEFSRQYTFQNTHLPNYLTECLNAILDADNKIMDINFKVPLEAFFSTLMVKISALHQAVEPNPELPLVNQPIEFVGEIAPQKPDTPVHQGADQPDPQRQGTNSEADIAAAIQASLEAEAEVKKDQLEIVTNFDDMLLELQRLVAKVHPDKINAYQQLLEDLVIARNEYSKTNPTPESKQIFILQFNQATEKHDLILLELKSELEGFARHFSALKDFMKTVGESLLNAQQDYRASTPTAEEEVKFAREAEKGRNPQAAALNQATTIRIINPGNSGYGIFDPRAPQSKQNTEPTPSSPRSIELRSQQVTPLKSIVQTATDNYTAWSNAIHSGDTAQIDAAEKNSNYRGPSGRFTKQRHNQNGIEYATNFLNKIKGLNDEKKIINEIGDFLTKWARNYHRHSFSSFLLDALIKQAPEGQYAFWKNLKTNDASTQGLYKKSEVKAAYDAIKKELQPQEQGSQKPSSGPL